MKTRSLNKYYTAMFLFENELTRETKVFSSKIRISMYFTGKKEKASD